MSEETLGQVVQTQFLIETDLALGRRQTFDYFIRELTIRGQMEGDIFTLANSNSVLIDLGINSRTPYRAYLYRYLLPKPGKQPTWALGIWQVDNLGRSTTGDIYHIEEYRTAKNTRTVIYGSSTIIEEREFKIKPSQLAAYIDEALGNLNDHNWRLVSGKENVPTGKV